MRSRFGLIGILLSGLLVLFVSGAYSYTNLVTNPDLKVDTNGYAFGADYGTFAVDPTVKGLVGNAALAKITKVGANAWEPELHSPAFNLVNGKTYTFAFWAKTEAGKTKKLGCSLEQMETYVSMGEEKTITDKWVDYYFTGVWTNPSSPPQVVIHIGCNYAPEALTDAWFSYFRVYEGAYVLETTSVRPADGLATSWGKIKNR